MASITTPTPIALAATVAIVAAVAAAWNSGGAALLTAACKGQDTNLATAAVVAVCVCGLVCSALWWLTDRCSACAAAPVASAVASVSTAVLLPSLTTAAVPAAEMLALGELAHAVRVFCPVHGYHLVAPSAASDPTWRAWPSWGEWTAWPAASASASVGPRVPAQPPPLFVPNYDPAGPLSQSGYLTRKLAEAVGDALPFEAIVAIAPNAIKVELDEDDEL